MLNKGIVDMGQTIEYLLLLFEKRKNANQIFYN